jgi:hypothetical protein
VPLRAEEAPSVVAEMRTPTTPPPPASTATVEEGEAATEATVTRAAPEAPSGAGPSVEGEVVVLDEDTTPPPTSERHDAAVVLVLESAQVPVMACHLPTVEVSVPPSDDGSSRSSPDCGGGRVLLGPSFPHDRGMMDLETYRYNDLPGVGVIDLEAPQLPEKEYDAAAEWRSNELTIMETIASVSKALQEYERAGGFAPATAEDTEEVALAVGVLDRQPTKGITRSR